MGLVMTGFKSRRKVDPALIARYEWDARYNGEKNIRNEISTAKRTATILAKSSSQFKHLRPEHQLALDAAMSAMRKLAEDLTELCAWAKDYQIFCKAEFARERAATLEAFAQARWGNDNEAMLFEANLIQEVLTSQGREAFGHWMHSMGSQLDVKVEHFTACFDSLSSLTRESPTNRKAVAQLIETASDRAYCQPSQFIAYDKSTRYCFGLKDFENYLHHRKAAAASANEALRRYTV